MFPIMSPPALAVTVLIFGVIAVRGAIRLWLRHRDPDF